MKFHLFPLSFAFCCLVYHASLLGKPAQRFRMENFNLHQRIAALWLAFYIVTFGLYAFYKQRIQLGSFFSTSKEWPILLPVLATKNGEPAGIGVKSGLLPDKVSYKKLLDLFSQSPNTSLPLLDKILQRLYGPIKIVHLPSYWGISYSCTLVVELEHIETEDSSELRMRMKRANGKKVFEIVYQKSPDDSQEL